MDLTELSQAVIGLVSVVITAIIVPYVRKKTSQEEFKELQNWAGTFVNAAEKIYKGAGRGEEKLEYALLRLEQYSTSKGRKFDSDQLKAVLEAEVNKLWGEILSEEIGGELL